MIIGHETQIISAKTDAPGAKGAAIKAIIGAEQGWDDYVMRIIDLEPGGHSPRHTHDWPHINYMIQGEGILYMQGKETEVKAGSFAYVPAGVEHQYRNTGRGNFRFICIVPAEGHVV